jgi:hypothetical protein
MLLAVRHEISSDPHGPHGLGELDIRRNLHQQRFRGRIRPRCCADLLFGFNPKGCTLPAPPVVQGDGGLERKIRSCETAIQL